MDKIRIWHISDTHGYHDLLQIPEKIDLIIFSGDCANYRDKWRNEPEVKAFLNWFADIATYKIMIAGNHDSSIEHKLIKQEDFNDRGIIYLENDITMFHGFKIWGSPYTPTFGNWSFMKSRDKIDEKVWKYIPEDVDILITHGPPKGVLDLTYNMDGSLFRCGCNALKKRILSYQPKYNLFGHIHNQKDLINAGTNKLSVYKTIFSNGSVVTDFKFGKLTSNGNILEL